MAITPLRQRMIEDMNARKLCAGTQRGHIRACRRFAAFLKRSPETATREDIRNFQLHVAETGVSICSACNASFDSQLGALPIRPTTVQPASTLLRLHPSIAGNRSPLPLRANLRHLRAAASSTLRSGFSNCQHCRLVSALSVL